MKYDRRHMKSNWIFKNTQSKYWFLIIHNTSESSEYECDCFGKYPYTTALASQTSMSNTPLLLWNPEMFKSLILKPNC